MDFGAAVDWLRERLPEQPQEKIEPVDLWGQFEPPALPHKLLPKVIENYAIAMGETMGADPAGAALATRLRLSPQSRSDPKTIGRQQAFTGPRPWGAEGA